MQILQASSVCGDHIGDVQNEHVLVRCLTGQVIRRQQKKESSAQEGKRSVVQSEKDHNMNEYSV